MNWGDLNMIKKYRSWILILSDLSIVSVAYFVALWIRYDMSFRQIEPFQVIFRNLWIILMVHFLIFKLLKVDKTLWRQPSIDEALRIGISTLIGFLIVGVFFIVFWPIIPRSVAIIGFLIAVVSIEFTRFFYRFYKFFLMKSQASNPNNQRTVIVGAGEAGVMLLKEILHNKKYNNDIIGFIDDNPMIQQRLVHGYTVLGKSKDIKTIVEEHRIDLIYIAIPSISLKRKNEIIQLCYQSKAKVLILNNPEKLLLPSTVAQNLRPISIEDLLGRREIELDNHLIKGEIFNKTVLVTGAGGSIGSELCRQLIAYKPKTLILVDMNENGVYDLQSEFNQMRKDNMIDSFTSIVAIIHSICDYEYIEDIFKVYSPQVIFHAAAHKHVPLMEDVPKEAIKNNVFGSYNLIDLSNKYEVETFVNISTDKAVNPTNVMGATKRMVEMMIQAFQNEGKTKFVAVRFGNVLGSNGSVIPLFKRQIEKGGPVTVTHKDMIRYFMTIPEAVTLILQAATFGHGGEIFVLDMGEPVKIIDLAEKMIELSGFKAYKDIEIVFSGLRPGEKLFEELLMEEEGMKKTSNKLIYIAKPMDINRDIVNRKLDILNRVIHSRMDNDAVKQKLSEVVDTYSPQVNKKEEVII